MADEVELAWQKLWALYRSGYHAYLGDAERWESMMKRLVPELPANPYFRWFVTEANSSPVRPATKLLDTITPDMPVGKTHLAYYHNPLLYRGHGTADELLSIGEDGPYRFETVGYGVANWYLVEGDTARAVEILEACAVDPWWPGYGRIAAEVELARLGR